MPTLWLPTDNPWEFRRLPFLNSSNNPLIDNIDTWDKQDWIEFLAIWSVAEMAPDTPEQKELLESARNLHKGVSKWLQFYELGRQELLGDLLSPKWNLYKPYADFSMAVLRFCQQAYLRLERWQSPEHSAITLWGICELSTRRQLLRKSGYYGNPDVDSRGCLLGKGIQYKQNNQTIKIHENTLKNGEDTGEFVRVQFPDEDLLDFLLHDAVRFVNNYNDADLEFHCKQLLNAFKHFNWLVNNHSYETIQISNKGVHTSTRGKYSPKGFSTELKSKPRRGRGRPPKGQSQQL